MSEFHELLAFRLDCLRRALCAVVATLDRGREKHPRDEGFRETCEFHIDRARKHLDALAAGDRSEPHLEHCCVRLLMALEARKKA